MPDVVWGGLQRDLVVPTCSTIGIQPGPGGGDGWTKIASLPKTKLLSSRHYAFVVSGTLRNIQITGATPNRGLCQVVLGDDSGVKSTRHCFELGVNWPVVAAGGGVPFQFLVIFANDYGPFTEPAWGATWPNTEDLSLYARTFWNGDPAAYAVTFEVHGITWLWFDLDNIGAARHFADVHAPAAPIQQLLTGSLTSHHIGAALPGSASEKWLHFVNLVFTPLADPTGGGPVRFAHVRTATGSLATGTTAIGSRRFGCLSRGAPYSAAHRNPTMHFGSFCSVVRPAGTQQWGVRGDGEALVHRWSHLAVRIDELPEVATLGLNDVNAGGGVATLLHEPPPMTGSVAQPIYLASLRAYDTSLVAGHRAHRARLVTHHGRVLWDGPPVDSLTGEGVPIFAADVFGLGPGDGPRYENVLLQAAPAWAAGQDFRADDVEFCQLWLIKDPTIAPPDPPEPGDFVVVTPSREGVALGSQQTLPVAPLWEGEDPATPRAEILGSTGVRRTWPLFTGPRRQWTLSWPSLTASEGEALRVFLRDNPTFKARPPQESGDVVLLAVEPPQLTMRDPKGPTWSCSVRVVELIFVGGA